MARTRLLVARAATVPRSCMELIGGIAGIGGKEGAGLRHRGHAKEKDEGCIGVGSRACEYEWVWCLCCVLFGLLLGLPPTKPAVCGPCSKETYSICSASSLPLPHHDWQSPRPALTPSYEDMHKVGAMLGESRGQKSPAQETHTPRFIFPSTPPINLQLGATHAAAPFSPAKQAHMS